MESMNKSARYAQKTSSFSMDIVLLVQLVLTTVWNKENVFVVKDLFSILKVFANKFAKNPINFTMAPPNHADVLKD